MGIISEFRLITGGHGEWRFITKRDFPTLLDEGDLVNIYGEPYVIYRRGIAFSTPKPSEVVSPPPLYAYYDLNPLQGR